MMHPPQVFCSPHTATFNSDSYQWISPIVYGSVSCKPWIDFSMYCPWRYNYRMYSTRPPNSDSDYLNSLFLYLSNLITQHDHNILVGGFSFPGIDWNTLFGSSLPSKSFCDLGFQNNLSQLVHSLTPWKVTIYILFLLTPMSLLAMWKWFHIVIACLLIIIIIISFQLSLFKPVLSREMPRYHRVGRLYM